MVSWVLPWTTFSSLKSLLMSCCRSRFTWEVSPSPAADVRCCQIFHRVSCWLRQQRAWIYAPWFEYCQYIEFQWWVSFHILAIFLDCITSHPYTFSFGVYFNMSMKGVILAWTCSYPALAIRCTIPARWLCQQNLEHRTLLHQAYPLFNVLRIVWGEPPFNPPLAVHAFLDATSLWMLLQKPANMGI